jgi:predicted GIY-YIG superfamily endonuclease
MYIIYKITLPNDMFYFGVAKDLNSRISNHWSESRTHGRRFYSNLKKIKEIYEQCTDLTHFAGMFDIVFAGTKEEAYIGEAMLINDTFDFENSMNAQKPKLKLVGC